MDIRLSGKTIQATVVALKGPTLQEAEAFLKANPDGRDTLAGTWQGKDVLVLAKGLKNGPLTLDGQPVAVAFFENEVNTAKEGVKAQFKPADPDADPAWAKGLILGTEAAGVVTVVTPIAMKVMGKSLRQSLPKMAAISVAAVAAVGALAMGVYAGAGAVQGSGAKVKPEALEALLGYAI